jgi:hypothetical protein
VEEEEEGMEELVWLAVAWGDESKEDEYNKEELEEELEEDEEEDEEDESMWGISPMVGKVRVNSKVTTLFTANSDEPQKGDSLLHSSVRARSASARPMTSKENKVKSVKCE